MRFVFVTVVDEKEKMNRDWHEKISSHEGNNYLNLIGHINEQCTVGRTDLVCMHVNKNGRDSFLWRLDISYNLSNNS